MAISLQKANFWKRISAYLFDIILAIILTMGAALAVSSVVKYDTQLAKLSAYQAEYEEEYGVEFDITDEQFNELSQEEQTKLEQAKQAFQKDKYVLSIYQTIFYLTLLIISLSLLVSYFIIYFIVPLLFKNGQTLGKKIFGLAVMRTNCVKVSNPVLFVRAILGLYTMETMVPVLLVLMLFFGMLGGVGVITLGLFGILQIVVMIVTQTNSSIHDLLSDTVVVDMASQMIFDTDEERIAYLEAQQKELAERTERVQ